MLFLMNDALLDLGGPDAGAAPAAERLRALTLAHVLRLGAELYSERPLLHRDDPERARRLAMLIRSRSPEVTAALFSAPTAGCAPEAVTVRVAAAPPQALAALSAKAAAGRLTPASADREVWRRMAA